MPDYNVDAGLFIVSDDTGTSLYKPNGSELGVAIPIDGFLHGQCVDPLPELMPRAVPKAIVPADEAGIAYLVALFKLDRNQYYLCGLSEEPILVLEQLADEFLADLLVPSVFDETYSEADNSGRQGDAVIVTFGPRILTTQNNNLVVRETYFGGLQGSGTFSYDISADDPLSAAEAFTTLSLAEDTVPIAFLSIGIPVTQPSGFAPNQLTESHDFNVLIPPVGGAVITEYLPTDNTTEPVGEVTFSTINNLEVSETITIEASAGQFDGGPATTYSSLAASGNYTADFSYKALLSSESWLDVADGLPIIGFKLNSLNDAEPFDELKQFVFNDSVSELEVYPESSSRNYRAEQVWRPIGDAVDIAMDGPDNDPINSATRLLGKSQGLRLASIGGNTEFTEAEFIDGSAEQRRARFELVNYIEPETPVVIRELRGNFQSANFGELINTEAGEFAKLISVVCYIV